MQDKCHPQTIAVCQSRAEGLGLEAVVISEDSFEVGSDVSGVLIQYPATDGSVSDYAVRLSSAAPAIEVQGGGDVSSYAIRLFFWRTCYQASSRWVRIKGWVGVGLCLAVQPALLPLRESWED